MKSKPLIPLMSQLVVLFLLLSACRFTPLGQSAPSQNVQGESTAAALPTALPSATVEPTEVPVGVDIAGPVNLITGEFDYTNDFAVETYYVEQAVELYDMTGFIKRDREWELPVDSQVLGFLKVDPQKNHGAFRLQLPIRPAGVMNDVDNNSKKDAGVQVFAIAYSPNLTGGPFAEGDDRSLGWPSYLASVKTDSENQDEVIGGKLVVWAPDDQQQFPTGFGPDGRLFTADDPEGPLPAGYSVIDLDQKPFGIQRNAEATMTLYEPKDVAIKDYSALSYSEAFDKMFETVRKEYAFNGVQGKQPDWDALYAELAPRVKDAEQKKDAQAYYLALHDFVLAFHDGHVGLNGGQFASQLFSQLTAGGYGFAIRELDNGKVIVTYLLADGPALKAGIQKGAVITSFNGEPILQALRKVKPLSGPFSTVFALYYQQDRYLLRTTPGTQATVEFTNPGGSSQKVTLTAIAERESFSVTSLYYNEDPNALPVEFKILDSGVGYIKINSNYDDLNLIIRLFQRALKTFESNKVPGIIIDLRRNSGGSPLGLAGFLTDQEIPLGQLEYYSDKTGKFEPEGDREKVYPNQEQYHFDKMALLVDQACYSACEIEAYGFSQVPGMIVVGQYPTGGVEAEVARGQFNLPEGMSLQVPTGRFTLPDGSLFLEGKGVVPTLKVPIDEKSVLSDQDVVLTTAEGAVLQPLGAGITPSGSPKIGSDSEARQAAQSGTPLLDSLAREQYNDLPEPGQVHTYTVALGLSSPVLWANFWCATTNDILKDNLAHIQYKFTLNGQEIPVDKFVSFDTESQGQPCHVQFVLLDQWPAGEHHLETVITFDKEINDGMKTYPAGERHLLYNVYIKP